MHACRADVAGDALERVREPFGERKVAVGESAGDLIERRTLLLGELAKELQVEFPIAADPRQAIVRSRPAIGGSSSGGAGPEG